MQWLLKLIELGGRADRRFEKRQTNQLQNVAGTRQAEAAAQSLPGLGQKLKQPAEQYKV